MCLYTRISFVLSGTTCASVDFVHSTPTDTFAKHITLVMAIMWYYRRIYTWLVLYHILSEIDI